VQGEGGLNVASAEWMRGLETLARKHGSLLIVDDIQAGCGRTGTFFSFEEMGISPDIVTLAKSLSGMGLPFAMVMLKPEHDVWGPAEHNGTFRGNNHAFVTARVALEKFWKDDAFAGQVRVKGDHLAKRLAEIAKKHGYAPKGRGMFRGIDVREGETAAAICAACFERGLVIETSCAHDEIVKVLAPLTIKQEQLDAGLDILAEAFEQAHRKAAAA
jgi:diaminobutyrate-2-oxoglutarate transaminase